MNISKNNLEKLLLVLSLGLTEAIKAKAISIDDAEKILYGPSSLKVFKNLKLNEKLIDLINLGTELEDIEDLLPEKLEKNLDEMSKISTMVLAGLPKLDSNEPRWYKALVGIKSLEI